ncbi:endonuclease/exonuclease/phosphatase family protein [Rubinisphaera italica]|nr:endonuclease/exonuclease/phosphatase family protein [Rubinisphaera italica]
MAITVYPIWVWTIPCLITLLLYGTIFTRQYFWIMVPFLALTYLISDTPIALIRGLYQNRPPVTRAASSQSLRVITLNCHDSAGAILALAKYEPDIILIQETVSRDSLDKLRIKIFSEAGFSAWDPDVAILSKYPLEEIPAPFDFTGYCLPAKSRIPTESGTVELLLVPVHLYAPPFRLDLWNPECWQAYSQHRKLQRSQLNSVLKELPSHSLGSEVLIAGDFNAPPGDAIFSPLSSGMQDAFEEVGVGWGCTIANQLPLIRIDQCWSTPALKPIHCQAIPSEGSDHRAVLVDYKIDESD